MNSKKGTSRKKAFLLLELLIALSLAATLLTLLFQFLISHTRFERVLEKGQKALTEEQRLYQRIDTLLLSLDFENRKSPFYTAYFPNEKESSLVAQFNAGIDPDPLFSGPNIGRLFIDPDNRLCFAQWPLEKEGLRTEVLTDRIAALEWEFLGRKLDKDPNATQIAGTWAWLKMWPKGREGTPSIIRLKIWKEGANSKRDDPSLRLAFILPTQDPVLL